MKKIVLMNVLCILLFVPFVQGKSTSFFAFHQVEVPKMDGAMMKDGVMMLIKSGKMSLMTSEMTLENGTRIMRDGTVIQKDGTKVMLKEGDHIDLEGKITKTKPS